MSFYGRSNRLLIEQELRKGGLKDSEIAECDLNGLKTEKALWTHTDLRDLHANDVEFQKSEFEKSVFFRSSFMGGRFLSSTFDNMTLDGLTLIKSQWRNCVINNTTIRNVCLQRAQFSGNRIVSSALLDFEALNVQINNCIFAHSMFSISYGSGMNGFSSAKIQNCIFFNCRFEGYPLRGASLESSVFAYCAGEIGDEMDCDNVAGLGLRGRAGMMPLYAEHEAVKFLAQCAS
jgi:uncharacterized protein YjbI with pentapeptide repeats